nr:TM2 domain-containing protein [Campylobacter sp.]
MQENNYLSYHESKKPPLELNKAYLFWAFLGIFGGHRFYLGKFISGLFQAICGVVTNVFIILCAGLIAIYNTKKTLPPDYENIAQVGLFGGLICVVVMGVWLLYDLYKLKFWVNLRNQNTDELNLIKPELKDIKKYFYINNILGFFLVGSLFIDPNFASNPSVAWLYLAVFVAWICCIVLSILNAARFTNSDNLVFNYIISQILSLVVIFVLSFGIVFDSQISLIFAILSGILYLGFVYLYYAELFDLSEQKIFKMAFWVLCLILIMQFITLLGKFENQTIELLTCLVYIINIVAWNKTKNLNQSQNVYMIRNLRKKFKKNF